MTIESYQDFILFADDVTLNAHGALESFAVRVFDSPAGQSDKEKIVHLPKRVFDDTVEFSHALRLLRDGAWNQELDKQIELGQALADLLMPEPDVRHLYYRSLDWVSEHDDLGLRVRLRLPRELSPFPWEYMHVQRVGGERTARGFLARHPRVSIVRHEALPIPARWFAAGERRRVLVVMATPDGLDRLEYLPDEQRQIRSALADVQAVEAEYVPDLSEVFDAEQIPSARLGQMLSALEKQTDILHFSGHGVFAQEPSAHFDILQGWGSIVLARENNQPLEVSADELAEFVGHRGIRLVVLGACETAETDPLHAWSGVAVSLLGSEIPAVVAMQFRVDDKLTALFMGKFYTALAGGDPIDQAVFQGRQRMRLQMLEDGSDAIDWVAPVLYLRTPGGRIFPPIRDEAAREAAAQSSADEARLNEAWHSLLVSSPSAVRGRGRPERQRAALRLLSRSDLEALAARKRDLGLQPLQALLLLVSAVVADTKEEPWLQELGTAEGKGFIRRLDSIEPSVSKPSEEVQRLLGLESLAEEEKGAGVGPVAWSAAHHPARVTRRSAALALTVLDPAPREGLDRLERALRTVGGAPARWARRSELWGTLADADREVEALATKLSPLRRLGIWGWRVWRRIARESEWLIARVICSALGAGLALGVWRALITLLADEPWPLFFFIHSYLGGLFGFFAILGMSLAGPTFLHRRGEAPSPGRLGRRAAATGTLFFAIANVVLALFTLWKPSERPWQPLTGALFGLGLCLALYGLPKPRDKPGVAGALVRLAVAAVVAVLAQALILLLAGERPHEALLIGLSASERERFYGHWFASGLDSYSGLDLLVMVFDTGATGAVLALGALIGLINARKVLSWWHRAAGDVE